MMEETFIHLLGYQHKWAPFSSACTLMLGAGETVSCVCRATILGILETWWDSSKGDVLLCMEAGPLGTTSQGNEVGELTFMWKSRKNTQSCLVMDEPAECLWVGISRQTNVDDMVGVWWRKNVLKAFRHLEEASCSQAVGLLNTPICAGWATKQGTSNLGWFFLVCSNDSFLTHVIENLLCRVP